MMSKSTSCALISAPITVRFNQEIDGAVLIECAYHHCRSWKRPRMDSHLSMRKFAQLQGCS